MTRRRLQIRRIKPFVWCRRTSDGRPLAQFPWNTYYRVIDGDRRLAVVSVCNGLDKGLFIERGVLTTDERGAVARALKVRADIFGR